MRLTVSLDDDLVKTTRRIAMDRGTTLTGMIRDYLEGVAATEVSSDWKRQQQENLERTFEEFQLKIG